MVNFDGQIQNQLMVKTVTGSTASDAKLEKKF